MQFARAGTLAVHVEAAKRLLRELEQHDTTALQALGKDSGTDFFAAIEERDRVLAQLNGVVAAVSHEHSGSDRDGADQAKPMIAEIARAAAAALASHGHLMKHAREERDRLAAALDRAKQPDAVADRYAATSADARHHALSVTG